MSAVSFRSAAEFSLTQLAELYTAMFADYAYPIAVDAAWLAGRIVPEDLDLAASPVICVAGQAVGLAVLARRGRSANCAGFGITPPFRGRGLARRLVDEFVARAQALHVTDITLMVLADNLPAVQAYRRVGFVATRRLHWYDGRPQLSHTGAAAAIDTRAIPDVLDRAAAAALRGAVPFWQSADQTLARLPGLSAWTVEQNGRLQGLALLQPPAIRGAAHLHRLMAADEAAATALIAAIAAVTPRLSANEADDSPWHAVLQSAGLTVTHVRCDMRLSLPS